jgi:hypothetical protein
MQMPKSIVAVVLCSLFGATASAQYVQVSVEQDGSGQFSTITAALQATGSNPVEVHVGPGVYLEYGPAGVAVELNRSGIHLLSTDGPQTTIIDGAFQRCCVQSNPSSVLNDLELNGFTIRNGSSILGGGLKTSYDTIAVTNCVFDGNHAAQAGGGVFLASGSATFVDCTLINNTAGNGYGTSVQLEDCHACDNGPSALNSNVTWNSDSSIWELCNDCNDNGVDDDVDAAAGTLTDLDGNGLWDSCEPDCNGNGIADALECAVGYADDFNNNWVPDECDPDCDGDGLPDDYELEVGLDQDCNSNGIGDACDIIDGLFDDCDSDGVPDECQGEQEDCDGNGIPDGCDIQEGGDCNENEILDACELEDGSGEDLDGNDVLDSCECLADIDGNGNVYLDEIVVWMYMVGQTDSPADVDHSGLVDIRDLIYILKNWGECPDN